MPEAPNAPFVLLERSNLFSFLLDLIQRVYRPSIHSAVNEYGLTCLGKRVFVEHGLDVLDAIPSDQMLLPVKYWEAERPNMLRQIGDARKRKLIQYQRFMCGPIHECHSLEPKVVDLR